MVDVQLPHQTQRWHSRKRGKCLPVIDTRGCRSCCCCFRRTHTTQNPYHLHFDGLWWNIDEMGRASRPIHNFPTFIIVECNRLEKSSLAPRTEMSIAFFFSPVYNTHTHTLTHRADRWKRVRRRKGRKRMMNYAHSELRNCDIVGNQTTNMMRFVIFVREK